LYQNRFQWRYLRLNTKVVTFMTIFLLISGTILLKWTTDETWLEAWFQSVIARTAGFSTFSLAKFTQPALLVFCVLMFIGASPGSTGGGIKTTTFFAVAFQAISSTVENNRDEIFHRKFPSLVFRKALTVLFYGLAVVFVGTFLILFFEPDLDLSSVLVEVTSAFATVGSTVGITPGLSTPSKIVLMICMFIGRLGPTTIATLYIVKGMNEASYTEEDIMIG
ncbi:potassium transporter TrkG, partial [Dubosiella newyorkensis]